MKKELSVVLAAVLSFVLAVPVFSADSPETTIEKIDLKKGTMSL